VAWAVAVFDSNKVLKKKSGCCFWRLAVANRLGNTLCDQEPSCERVPKQIFRKITRGRKDSSAWLLVGWISKAGRP